MIHEKKKSKPILSQKELQMYAEETKNATIILELPQHEP